MSQLAYQRPPPWSPQPGPQEDAIQMAAIPELFFGGARGGGKSDYLIGDFVEDVHQGPHWHGILFRKSFPELTEIIRRTMQIYGPCYGAEWRENAKTWTFPSGAKLRLAFIDTLADAMKYQGHSYSWIAFDELTNWESPSVYHMMKATLRGAATHKRIRASGNPGGPGHVWVKDYFVDPDPLGYTLIKNEDGEPRIFIPSKVADNKILLNVDPKYINRLKNVGDPEIVKAWLDGDWNALVGQFFIHYRPSEVEMDSYPVSPSWHLFGSIDYGESKPTAFGLFAVDYDDTVYMVDEYYVAELPASTHAQNIKARIENNPLTKGRWPSLIYADPSMWTQRRLEDVYTKSAADVFREHGVHLVKANNDRVNGWRICSDALYRKQFKVFRDKCPNFIKTVPTLPRDANNPEDLDTHSEDHCFSGDTLVDSMWGQYPIGQIVGQEGLVWTFSPDTGVTSHKPARRTRTMAETVRLRFENGQTLTCTPDHRLLGEDGQWIQAQDMQGQHALQLSKLSRLRYRCLTRYGIINAVRTTSIKAKDCIARCMSTVMGLFQKASRSTTKTSIKTTTNPAIYGSCITDGTAASTASSKAPIESVTFNAKPLKSGMAQIEVESGTSSTTATMSRPDGGSPLPKPASNVDETTRPWLREHVKASIATKTVKRLRVVNVSKGKPQDVYCLEVPLTGIVSVNGGILAHNCADAWRYLMIHEYQPYSHETESPKGTAQEVLDDLAKAHRKKRRRR